VKQKQRQRAKATSVAILSSRLTVGKRFSEALIVYGSKRIDLVPVTPAYVSMSQMSPGAALVNNRNDSSTLEGTILQRGCRSRQPTVLALDPLIRDHSRHEALAPLRPASGRKPGAFCRSALLP